MNALVLNQAALPAAILQTMGQMTKSELSEGVGAKFAVVSIRGKVFRIKYGGVEQPVTMDVQGQRMAAPFIDVVIPIASGALSKTFYKGQFQEGTNDQPDCWSEDGITPLAPLQNRPIVPANGQHCTDCRLCPYNAFGSKITESGKQAKACADTRKLIVVPAHDLENAAFGGPMMMRVPAASLAPLAEFDRAMTSRGIPYFAVVVRIGFDQDPAYPKLTFTPVRMVTDAEAAKVLEYRNSEHVKEMLRAAQANPTPDTTPTAFGPSTGEIPGYAPSQPTAASVAPAAPATAAPVQPAAPQFAPAPTQPAVPQFAPAPPQPAAAQFAPAPTQPAAAQFAPAPTQPAAPQFAPAPTQPAVPLPPQGGDVPAATPALLSDVDALLAM